MKEKTQSYYSIVRQDIFALLPPHTHRLLDVGCGSGETSIAVRDMGRADWICGVETNPQMAHLARSRMDALIEGDVEKVDLRIPGGAVDVILALDVLEHLIDPWSAIRHLTAVLNSQGILIASIPNIRHLRVLLPLIFRGEWEYQESGLLDSTHLRFFTRKSAIALMTSTGLHLEDVRMSGFERGSRAHFLNMISCGLFQDFFANQYLIRVKKI